MKLVAVAMVRNEEDIVEAFVRHNLSVLDGMIVVDHGSADRTLAVLNALCAERLPLVVLRSDAAGYLQAEITTTAARDAFARARARSGVVTTYALRCGFALSIASMNALVISSEENCFFSMPSRAAARVRVVRSVIGSLKIGN